MGLPVFVIVTAAVVGGPLVWFLWRSRLKPGATNMVLIWHAAGEADRATTLGALTSAGVWTHVIDSGPYYPMARDGTGGGYRYEIWVRARDEDRAREVLGL